MWRVVSAVRQRKGRLPFQVRLKTTTPECLSNLRTPQDSRILPCHFLSLFSCRREGTLQGVVGRLFLWKVLDAMDTLEVNVLGPESCPIRLSSGKDDRIGHGE
jgi:hypothetical protein